MKAMLAAAIPVMLAHGAAAQPSLTLLSGFDAQALSADGRVVVGSAPDHAAYWTRDGGTVSIQVPTPPGTVTSKAVAVSGDGSVIAGYGTDGHGGVVVTWVWTPQGATVLSVPDLLGTLATCVSRDGRTVGGIASPPNRSYQSFVWTAEEGYRMLPWGTNYATWLHGLSADGRKAAGSGSSALGTWPAYWGSTYVWCQNIGPLAGLQSAIANAISDDGSTLVGDLNGGGAFVWTARDGLTAVDDADTLETVSSNGRIAGGKAWAGTTRGLVWVRGAGTYTASAYFAARGVPGVPQAARIIGVSSNERVFLGATIGTFYTQAQAAIIDLGRCGSADFNHDGSPGTDADIEAFFRCLAGDCCPLCDSADFNYDGDAATDADIEAFFRVLAGGSC